MIFDFPTQTIFYTIEHAIKQYRKMSQKNISGIVSDITIDQALVLIILEQQPERSQVEIAELLFKDDASITRMIALMVRNGFISRSAHKEDRRRSALRITKKGRDQIALLIPVIRENRARALKNIEKPEIEVLQQTLRKIIHNCY